MPDNRPFSGSTMQNACYIKYGHQSDSRPGEQPFDTLILC